MIMKPFNGVVVICVVLTISGLQFRAAVAEPQAAAATLGTYVISCFIDRPQGPCLPGNKIPVGEELVLNAHVTDSSGNLAATGTEIFQDCLLNGVPAPSVQCDSGPGVWSNIQTVHLTFNRPNETAEDIRIGYGSSSTAQTIGFRFRYLNGHASGIANGISNSMDVTWF